MVPKLVSYIIAVNRKFEVYLLTDSLPGKEADSIIKSGGLIPDDKIVSLIKTELVQRNWLNSQSSWLLDGFPRTSVQAAVLDSTLQEHDAMLNLVVELDVPEEVILDRIENRYVVSTNDYVLTILPY